MPTDYLLSMIVLPLVLAACLQMAPWVTKRFFRTHREPDLLLKEHWSNQNRHFYEFSICRAYLRHASVILCTILIAYLWYHTGSALSLIGIPLLLFSFVWQEKRHGQFVTALRDQWNRIDLAPYQLPLGIEVLFQLPTILFATALFALPREVSLLSLSMVGLLAVLAVFWYGFGNLFLARRIGTVKTAPTEITSKVHDLCEQMHLVRRPEVLEARTDQLNAFAYSTVNCVVFTAPLLHHFPLEQILAIARHELGHLKETTAQKRIRLLFPLVYLPFFLVRPLSNQWGMAEAIFVATLLYLILSRLFGTFQRKAEYAADLHTEPEMEDADQSAFAKGLLELHRQALLPAHHESSGTTSHPSLYDRLDSLGYPPDFAKPNPPESGPVIPVAVTYFVLTLALLVATQTGIVVLFF